MKFQSAGLALALAIALNTTTANAAAFLNGGFETGDLSGWTTTPGLVEVITEADDAIVTPPFGEQFTPVEGGFFARLTAGADLGVYTVLSQAFELTALSTVSGSAAFLAFDYAPYDDDAFVQIVSVSTNELLFSSSVGAVGDYGHTPWTNFVSGPLAAGNYVLQMGVRDNLEFGGSSQLLTDGFAIAPVPGAVPEPSTWLMMILGFAGVGAGLRRRRPGVCNENGEICSGGGLNRRVAYSSGAWCSPVKRWV